MSLHTSPEQVAEDFAHLNDGEQALFFNKLAEISKDWPSGGFRWQMSAVKKNSNLTPKGKETMKIIGHRL